MKSALRRYMCCYTKILIILMFSTSPLWNLVHFNKTYMYVSVLLNAKLLLTKKGFNKWLWNGWWIGMRRQRQVVMKCIDLYLSISQSTDWKSSLFAPLASHSWFRFTACVYFVGKRPWVCVHDCNTCKCI